MNSATRAMGRRSQGLGAWVSALMFVFLLAPAAAWGRCQIHVPMSPTPVTNIDGVIDGQWNDASITTSGVGCFSVFHRGTKTSPVAGNLNIHAKQDATNVYLLFDVPDNTGAPGPLPQGEKIFLHFDARPTAGAQLTVDSRKLVITNFRQTGPVFDTNAGGTCPSAPCSGSKSYYTATGTRMCSGNAVPFWLQSAWPTSIQIAVANAAESYKVELKIPKTDIAVATNDIVNLAFIVVNDLGTQTGGTEDAFAAKFPSDLPAATVAGGDLLINPGDPGAGCNGWLEPQKWGVASATLSGDVYIRQGDPSWTSNDIEVLSCQANYLGSGDAYNYYPDKPCRFKVRTILHNSTSTAEVRDVLVVVSPHGTGQPTWEVIDLIKNVSVAGNGTASPTTNYYDPTRPTPTPPLANDGGYLPKPYVNEDGHPCLLVYVLPTSDSAAFPKSQLTDGKGLSNSDLQKLVNAYGLSNGNHVAQQNISRTASPNCPNNSCSIAALPGGTLTGSNPFSSIRMSSLGLDLISGALAQPRPMEATRIPGNLLERYARDHAIVSIAAFGQPTAPLGGTLLQIIEPMSGVVQLFPAAMLKENGPLPIKLLVGNPTSVAQSVFLSVQATHVPAGLEAAQPTLPQGPVVLSPGQTTVVKGQIGEPCKCGDPKCAMKRILLSDARGVTGGTAIGLALLGTLGVGGFAFLRRKNKQHQQSAKQDAAD